MIFFIDVLVILSILGIDRCVVGVINICGFGICVNFLDGYRCVCSFGY